MKKASLKIKSYAGNVNIIDHGNLQQRLFKFMLWFLGLLACIYVFLLGSMVFNIIERKALENYGHILSYEVGNLELEYLSSAQKVDLNLAYSLGFKEIKTKFATRKTLGQLNVGTTEDSLDNISVAKNEI